MIIDSSYTTNNTLPRGGTISFQTSTTNNVSDTTFYTICSMNSINNIVANIIPLAPYTTTGGPYSNGYWLINVSKYTSQTGFIYLFLNISQPTVPIYWLGRVVISSGGSASYYPDLSYNVQVSYTSGNIEVSSPSGASLTLYYKIFG